VSLFAVLLRIAESLDRSHTGVVHNASLRALDQKNVVLEIFASQDCQLEIWGALNHEKAFKKTFGRTLQLEVAIDELAVQSDELTPARKEG
jgi:exopolyphosphatase/guanosine-5'-triphosphate,3'-diphosphate pyrophosphatase